jgi:hypothetical protein
MCLQFEKRMPIVLNTLSFNSNWKFRPKDQDLQNRIRNPNSAPRLTRYNAEVHQYTALVNGLHDSAQ